MNITIVCVGKIKEKFYRDAIAEYAKRLSRYCRFTITEVEDEKTPENASEEENRQILEKEGARILKKLPERAYVVALAIEGKMQSSVGFSEMIDELTKEGHSTIVFVIGGSLGLSPAVLARADRQLSFSAMTFPHQLMRVILSEQIYRAFRIIHHEPYHK